MPDVATATPATAAQTQAAGTRLLGYYLGSGGVKVDCLFDTANFLTKNAAGYFATTARVGIGSATDPSVLLHLRGGGYGATQLRLDSSATQPNIAFYNGDANAANRNYAIVAGHTAFGDLTFRCSNAQGGDPLAAGTNTFRILSGPRYEYTVNGGGKLFIEQAGTTSVQIRSSATLRYIVAAASAHQFYIDGTSLVQIGPTALTPGSDNSVPLGSASFRWSEVRAVNGSIITSDERDKTWRGSPTEAELAAAKRIVAELGFYQWDESITEKGPDGARLHFGVRAQAVWAIMADEGLIDPLVEDARPDSRYAFLCYDEWDAIEAVDEVRDEEGNVVSPASPARPAGNRFGVRPDQLALFLIAAQEARLAALEAAS